MDLTWRHSGVRRCLLVDSPGGLFLALGRPSLLLSALVHTVQHAADRTMIGEVCSIKDQEDAESRSGRDSVVRQEDGRESGAEDELGGRLTPYPENLGTLSRIMLREELMIS